MREQPLNDATLHPALAELPVFEPGADLWSRIAAAHAARTPAPRRPRRWLALAAAAAVAVAALIVVPRTRVDAGFVEGQRESQTLEQEWRALEPVSRSAAGLARLHVIDDALQAAYDRGAAADELKPLWKQRNDALRGLIVFARADAVTRI